MRRYVPIKTEIMPEWVLAQKDDNGIISVGGLAHRIGAFEALRRKKKGPSRKKGETQSAKQRLAARRRIKQP
jgi:hypothetical protein